MNHESQCHIKISAPLGTVRDGWPKPNPAVASYDNLEKGEVTVVDLSPDGGVPDRAAESGWCLFSGSAAVPLLSFPF